MDSQNSRRTIVVTGANKGIGYAIVENSSPDLVLTILSSLQETQVLVKKLSRPSKLTIPTLPASSFITNLISIMKRASTLLLLG